MMHSELLLELVTCWKLLYVKSSSLNAPIDGPFDGTVKYRFIIIAHTKDEAPIYHDSQIVETPDGSIEAWRIHCQAYLSQRKKSGEVRTQCIVSMATSSIATVRSTPLEARMMSRLASSVSAGRCTTT